MIQSALEDIPGIGSKSIEKLFKKFKSLERIRAASLDELVLEIGLEKATIMLNYLVADLR